MDKYEFNIKVEQIKKLAAKKNYKEAADIAKEMDWHKVKDWSVLALIINVQESAGDFLEARDMAILAYNRNLGGRKLVYKLTEILIKLEDFETAEELYQEYKKSSPNDVSRFILYYDLRKAQKAKDNELVEILEEYKSHEIDEHYMYELAVLYSKTNRKEECIKICDDIVIWFQDGIYVEKAIILKKELGEELTDTQLKIFEKISDKEKNLEDTKEIMFQEELASINNDEIEEAMKEDEEDEYEDEEDDDEDDEDDGSIKSFFKRAFRRHGKSQEDDADEEENDNEKESDEQDIDEKEDSLEEDFKKKTSKKEEIQENFDKKNSKKEAFNKKASKKEEFNKTDSDNVIVDLKTDTTADVKKSSKSTSYSDFLNKENAEKASENTDFSQNVGRVSMSLKEMIEGAKKKLANETVEFKNIDFDDVSDDEDYLPSDITEDKENESLENVSKSEAVKDVKDSSDISVTEGKTESEKIDDIQENQQEDQIEGQLNLSDWILSVKEEKYGKQDTKQFSRAELERMLDEKDEKSAAYEKLMEEQKAKAEAEGREFNKEEADRKARAGMFLQDVKIDLAVRAGKATVRVESEFAEGRRKTAQAAREKAEEEARIKAEEARRAVEEAKLKAELAERAALEAKNKAEAEERIKEEAEARIKAEKKLKEEVAAREFAEARLRVALDKKNSDKNDNKEINPLEAVSSANLASAVKQQEITVEKSDDDTQIGDNTVNEDNGIKEVSIDKELSNSKEMSDTKEDSKVREISDLNEIDDSEDDEKKLTGELAKIFKKYCEMPELENQLAEYFETLDKEMSIGTSEYGNIIISGNSSSDKSDLARCFVRAINYLYPDQQRKIAKTTGESINARGLTKAMPKLKGTALLVEGAGAIQPKRMTEVLNCLEQDTDRMIVIFEDSDAEMNVLLNFNPEMKKKFNHRIVLKQYTVNELVEMAKKYARKRQYDVDDDALLELYLQIDKLRSETEHIHLDDVKEIVNMAITRSEKRASRRFFGGLKKKRSEKGDLICLTEADFKLN